MLGQDAVSKEARLSKDLCCSILYYDNCTARVMAKTTIIVIIIRYCSVFSKFNKR
jgi:hypothetical protein